MGWQIPNVLPMDGCTNPLVLKSRSMGLYAPLRDSSKWERACPWDALELPAHNFLETLHYIKQ